MKKLLLIATLQLFTVAAFAITPTPTATPTATPIPVGTNFTLAWDANPPADSVTKYIVSFGPAPRSGTTFVYPNNVDVTSGTTFAFTAQPFGKLYLAVRAVNTKATSAYSTELVVDVQQSAPATPDGLRITVSGLTLVPLKPGKYVVTVRGKAAKKQGSVEIIPQG